MNSKTLVVGVGNPFRHDDGIGLAIVKILQEENNPSMIVVDGGTDGFSLFDRLALYEHAIIIDAVFMGESPGVIKLFSSQEAKLQIKGDALSTHGFGLADVLKLTEEFGVKTIIKIIGIQPESVDFGAGLSEVVKNSIPQILELVKREIKT